MPGKVHTAAVVIIPPHDAWRPIQVIRARYDRNFTRWMPHITMAYPYRPKEDFDDLVPRVAEELRGMPPFQMELAQLFFFDHGYEKYTLWLNPEPREPLFQLQAALSRVTPECNDVAEYEFGFTPHLSVGQARGQAVMEKLRADVQKKWTPLSFRVSEVSLICCNEPPDDVFRVAVTLPLGGRTAKPQLSADADTSSAPGTAIK